MPAIFRQLATCWCAIDPRALGLFRLAFGLVCMVDVLRRVPHIRLFYSRDGVLPAHAVLAEPLNPYTFSLLTSFDSPAAVTLYFAATLVILCFFTVGFRTKFFHLLAVVMVLSIHNRNIFVEYAGDWVVNNFLILTLFLPLGRRFSVDALIGSMRAVKEKMPADLNDRAMPAPPREMVFSASVFAVRLQLALIYLFSALAKTGPAWRDGSATHYLLHSETFATTAGIWARSIVPHPANMAATWATMAIEWVVPFLILFPIASVALRRVALVLLLGLHGAIFLFADVGLFSWVMAATFFVLLSPPDIERLKRVLRRLTLGPLIVFYDSDCGFCHLSCRILKRLDRLQHLTFAGHDWPGEKPAGLEAIRLQTVVVWHRDRNWQWTRHRAFAAILMAYPFGFLVAWIFWLPGISWVLGNAYDRVAEHRARISQFIGLTACGLPAPKSARPLPAKPAPPPIADWLAKAGRVLREIVGVLVIAVMLATALFGNVVTREPLAKAGFERPEWLRAIVESPRMMQTWNMFSPNVPTVDGKLVIAAVTADGRPIDPQTGATPDFGPMRPLDGVTMGQLWRKYSSRIVDGHPLYVAHRDDFTDWVLRWHEFAGRPESDRIVRFDVFWVATAMPAPGAPQTAPSVPRAKKIFGYRP